MHKSFLLLFVVYLGSKDDTDSSTIWKSG